MAAIAVATLLLGVVIGYFLGRLADDGEPSASSPPLTSPSTSTSRPPGDTIPQAPLDTPPSTDLAPSSLGTHTDPIPAGQGYVLGLYEIAVRSVDRDAADALAAYAPPNPAPPPGRTHVLVEIEISFTDQNGLGNPASIPFFLSDRSGDELWYDYESSCGLVPDDLLSIGLLEQGDEAVGNVCFTVPVETVDDMLFGTEGFAGPIYFALPD